MVEQNHFGEMHRACSHNIERKLGLLIMQQRYGNVWKKILKEGVYSCVQAYTDLPHVKRDERWTLAALSFIGNFSLGPNDCFKVNKDLDTYDFSMKDVMIVNKELDKILRNEPNVMFFHITVVAGHGMHHEKSQCILLNVFDKSREFYKLYAIETMVR